MTIALKVDEVTQHALETIMMQWFPWSRKTKPDIEEEGSVHKSTKTQRQTPKEDIRRMTEELSCLAVRAPFDYKGLRKY